MRAFETGAERLYTPAPMAPCSRHLHVLIPALLAGVLVLLAPAHALGQSREFELDESGEFRQTREPEPGTDEWVMARARELLANDRPGEARSLLSDWIERNERDPNPYLPEAFLLRGDALTAGGNEYKALYDYEAVIGEFPASPEFVTALERELEIGKRYLAGLRRKFLGIRYENAKPIGEELLVRIQERLPRSQLAEQAAIELADFYYRERDMPMAAEMYGIFLVNYPESEHRKKAMQRRIYSNIARFKGPAYNAAPLIESQYLIEYFAQEFPADAQAAGLTDALVSRLDESLAAQLLESAEWYLMKGDEPSAQFTLRRLLRQHPGTVAAARAEEIFAARGWTLITAPPSVLEPIPAEPAGDSDLGDSDSGEAAPGAADAGAEP